MAAGAVFFTTVASASLTQIATMADLVGSSTTSLNGVQNISSGSDTVYYFNGHGITNITNQGVLDAFGGNSGYVTVAAWVNTTTTSGDHGIFSYGDKIKFDIAGSTLRATAWSVVDVNTSLTLGSGDWYMVALTVDLSRTDANTFMFLGAEDYSSLSQTEGKNLGSWQVANADNQKLGIGTSKAGAEQAVFSGYIGNLTVFTSETAATTDELLAAMGNAAPEYTLPQYEINLDNGAVNLDNYANGYQLIFDMPNTESGKYFATNAVKVVNSDVQIGATDGDGTRGMVITNGNGGNHQIFTGKLTGNGLIRRAGAANTFISFTGDTTGYSGNILLQGTGTFTLTFGTVTANNTTYTGKAGVSSAESGIIGNGTVEIKGNGTNKLVFNYGATASPIYITNTFTFDGNANSKVELNGAADYILTQEMDLTLFGSRFVKNTTGTVYAENGVINVASGTVETAATHVLTGGTLTKTGAGTLQLKHDVNYDHIHVQEGTLLWQSGDRDTGTSKITGGKITLESGTEFKISQTVNHNTGVDVVLNGGTIFSYDQGPVGAATNYAGFGMLDVQADSTLKYQYTSTMEFEGLTGTGNLDIVLENGTGEVHKTFLGHIKDYTGTISITNQNHQQLGIGTVTMSEGKELTLGYDVTSADFGKYGAGSLTLNGNLNLTGRFDAFYEGTLSIAAGKGITVANGATLVCREDGTGSTLNLGALPASLNLDISNVSDDALRAGINLGLAYSADLASKLQLSNAAPGKAFADYFSVTNDNGLTKLTLTNLAAEEAMWDANWGVQELLTAPTSLTATNVADGEHALHNSGDDLNYVAINATGGGDNAVIYGGRKDNGDNYVSNEAVWIKASSGKFLGLVGGSSASNWATGEASWTLNADTHIVVDGAEVGHVIGGFRQECHSPVMTGDTYISIKSGNITGNITGSNLLVDGDANISTHNGNSHVYIYTPLNNTTNAAYLQGGDAGAMDIITGGALAVYNSGQDYRQALYKMVGDTDVVVDLTGYSGSETGFKKAIYGGSHVVRPASIEYGNVCSVVMDGNSNVTITGAGSITFAGDIVGGSHIQGGAASISGTSSVSIDGGTYAGMVVGGSIVEAKSTTTVGGTSVKLSGGTYQQSVIGGTYAKAGAAEATVGNVQVTVSGNTTAGTIYGGSYIIGTDDTAFTASVGDIKVSITGGTVSKLVGGSYVERNAAGSTVEQGDITIELLGGSVGDVYAAGSQQGTSSITTGDITVKVGSGATLTGTTITAGYEPAATAPAPAAATTTTGNTLVLAGTQDRSGQTFDQFSTIEVSTAGTTAKVGALTGVSEITKTGAGALSVDGITMDTITVSEGTLILGGANTVGALTVADNSGLDLSTATSLGAAITLGNGASLAADGMDMGGKALTLGTGLQVSGTEKDGIITLLSNIGTISGITFDAEGNTAATNLVASINGEAAIDGWMLNLSNGSLTLINPALMVKEIAWSQSNTYWQIGQDFDGAGTIYEADKKYAVNFGELTNTDAEHPELVQVNGNVVADSIRIDAGVGQIYEFVADGDNSGIAAATKGIEVLSGTAIFRNGTLDMTEDTDITVGGGVLALEAGAIADQSVVDITLTQDGTLRWLAGNTTDYSLNGGLSIATGATEVTLDFGENAVKLEGEIIGSVSGVQVNLVGSANNTITVRPAVLGTSTVVMDGVNLALAAGVEYAASFANTAGEYISIESAAGEQTTLSGDNSGMSGEVRIGAGTTLVLKGSDALGDDMALKGTGNVAFAAPDGAATAEFTLTTDDTYTGTTTVRRETTLNWGEATADRTGDIVLDEGSTLKLTCAVANAIRDGLDITDLAAGQVIITSTTDADGNIVPIEWNNNGKTYSGLTTIEANTEVVANASLTAGNAAGAIDRVWLKDATSVLKITNAAWDGAWNAGHNVYGAGTVLLDSADATDKTFTNILFGGLVAAGEGNALANLTIATGNTLELIGSTSAGQAAILNNVQNVTVVDGATLVISDNQSNVTHTWHIAGTGVDNNGAVQFNDSTAGVDGTETKANIILDADATIAINDKFRFHGTIDGTAETANKSLTVNLAANKLAMIRTGSTIQNLTTLTVVQPASTGASGIEYAGGSTVKNIGTWTTNTCKIYLNGNVENVGSLVATSSEFTQVNGTLSGIGSMSITSGTTIEQNNSGSITGVSATTSTLNLASTGAATLGGAISDFKQMDVTASYAHITGTLSNVKTINFTDCSSTSNMGSLNNTSKLYAVVTGTDTINVSNSKLFVNSPAMYSENGSDAAAHIKLSNGAEVRFQGLNGGTTYNWKGAVTLANGTAVGLYNNNNTVVQIDGGINLGTADTDSVSIGANVTQTLQTPSLSGKGTLELTNHNDGHTPTLKLTSAGTFSGTIKANKAWTVEATAENALQYATVNLNSTNAKLKLGSATVNAAALVGTGSLTTATNDNTLHITNTLTTGADFTGTLADRVNVKVSGGYQRIGSTGQTGSHIFTAVGGTLDMTGYTRAADAAGADTIYAAGGTIQGLTLGAGMTLEQTAQSTLAGALTLAGGTMVYDLSKDGSDYSVGTLYTSAADTTLRVNTSVESSLVFRTDDLLPYIDQNNADDGNGNYVLISGISRVIDQNADALTDLSSLKTNFSNDGRAQYSLQLVDNATTGLKDLVLHVEGNAATLEWTGETEGGVWDTKTTDNWQIQGGTNGTDDMFYSDDSVVFGDVKFDTVNDPATEPVSVPQVVAIADAGVSIGSMKVTGGQYTFNGGAITSVEGMGDVTISGGNVVFNNSIATKGKLTISGGNSGVNVTLAAANSYTGETTLSGGNSVVTVTHVQGLSTTKTNIENNAELQLAVNGTMTTSEIALKAGNIYAKDDVTIAKLTLTNDAAKFLNVDTGKTMSVTVEGDKIKNTLFINEYKDVAGTVNMTVSNALTDMDDILVGKGVLNATFNGNVAQGGKITFRANTSGSMTFKGTAELGDIELNGLTSNMSFAETATLRNVSVANGTASFGFAETATLGNISTVGNSDDVSITAAFEKGASLGAITNNRGGIAVTVKGAATLAGNIASGTATTTLDFQGGVTSSDNTQRDLTVGGGGYTSLSFGAASTLGAVTVNGTNTVLDLGVSEGKTAPVLTTTSVTTAGTVNVTGGLTLKTGELKGTGALKLAGSTLEFSGESLAADVQIEGNSTLKSTHATGTAATGKTITLNKVVDAQNAVQEVTATMLGNWTLAPTTVVWATDANATLKIGQNDTNTATVTLTGNTTMGKVTLAKGSTVTAAAPAAGATNTQLTLKDYASIAGTVSNVDITITGEAVNAGIVGGANVGKVVVNNTDYDTVNKPKSLTVNSYDGDSHIADLDIKSGKVWVGNYCDTLTIGSIELDGEKAIMDFNGKGSLKTAAGAATTVTTTIYQGALANADGWTGHVDIVDTVEVDNVVTHNYRVYDLGGITDKATVNIGDLNANAETGEYSRLTNVGSLKLAGSNSITLIDAMTEANAQYSLFGVGTTGAVTLADGAELHIDINSVLKDLLGATQDDAAASFSTKFNLGGDLTGLQNHTNVVFDTALNLFNLVADFGDDGMLTLTQTKPMDGALYKATEKQGDTDNWVGNDGTDEVYDSTEGFSAIWLDKNISIDLTGEGVNPDAQADAPGVGLVLNNVFGTEADAKLSITGDGDDLVTFTNTHGNMTVDGAVAITNTDVQILNTKDDHTVDTASTLIVENGMTLDADSELKLVAGKLQLDGAGNQIAGGVTIADDGQAQLILNGDTALGGSIAVGQSGTGDGSMLAATELQWDDVDVADADIPHIVLGQGQTTTLMNDAVVETGVEISAAAGSTITVAENGKATISQAAEVAGAALNLAAGTELSIDTTATGGKLSFEGATLAGKLSSTADGADIVVNTEAGKASAISGDLSAYKGDLELAGAGTYHLLVDAVGTDVTVNGSTTNLVVDADGVASYRSLALTGGGTINANVVQEKGTANKKINTTEGITLGKGTLNLTANISQVREGGTVFTGGTVTVQNDATINLTVNKVTDAVASALINGGQTSVTLAESAVGTADVNIINTDQRLTKYFHNAVGKVVNGQLVITGEVVNGETADYHMQLGETENGKAGAAMLDEAYGSSMEAINKAQSDMKAVLTHLEDLIATGKTAGTDEMLAAVAGSSTAVLGMAASGDVERQLKAIRNRTTTMGVDQSVSNEEMPYFNAWINAEADHREMSEDGTMGGYKLNSWGGTVGFDADITPTFTAGMALTAMYGDLDATGVDKATGTLDSYYVSVFARYAPSAWTHTFVGTVGKADITLDRTVDYGAGTYKTEGETNAMSFGMMYETGYVVALNEDATACLQPVFNVTWRHTTVDGYKEKSEGDAGLTVGDQAVNTVTFGLGARFQAVVGESMYNRTSVLECRVLAKADVGDSSSTAENRLTNYNTTDEEVKSAEKGNFGVEAGVGLTIPVGQEGGSIFMDASLDLRADYINANGTVGYRVNF